MKKFTQSSLLSMISLLTAVLVVVSCSTSNDDPIFPTDDGASETIMQEVEFSFLTSSLSAASNGRALGTDGICSLEEADSAYVVVADSAGNTYNAGLDVRIFDGGEVPLVQTSPMLLPADAEEVTIYCVERFMVFREGERVAFLPPMDNPLAAFVNGGEQVCFPLIAFTKPSVDIELLCDLDQTNPITGIGFQLFNLDVVEAAEVCLFVDVCDPVSGDQSAEFSAKVVFPNGDDFGVVSEGNNKDNSNGVNSSTINDLLCLLLPNRNNVPDNEELFVVVVEVVIGDEMQKYFIEMTVEQALALRSNEEGIGQQFILLEVNCPDDGDLEVIVPDGIELNVAPCEDEAFCEI